MPAVKALMGCDYDPALGSEGKTKLNPTNTKAFTNRANTPHRGQYMAGKAEKTQKGNAGKKSGYHSSAVDLSQNNAAKVGTIT